MKKFALIVAGGSGSRMENNFPKQFIELNGRPILMRAIDVFLLYDAQTEIILVLPKNQIEKWNVLCDQYDFRLKYQVAFGGANRFQSVRNGLELIADDGIVFIHDGVRPLVSVQTIRNCYEMAANHGNALPVVSVNESLRFVDASQNRSVDRSQYVRVQTPQTFKTTLIRQAYRKVSSEDFTDDASVLEQIGVTINLVEGNRENIKITYPEDLLMAQSFFPNS